MLFEITFLIASVPVWIWATLIMIGFVALSALTMWLVRIPLRQPPPTISKEDAAAPKDER